MNLESVRELNFIMEGVVKSKGNSSFLSRNISNSLQEFSLKCYYFEERYEIISGFEMNFILIGVLNIILAIITSTLNIVTLVVIYRVKNLQTPSNFFISGLAIMDACTGIITFPSHAAVNFMLSAHWMSCPLRLFLTFAGYFFGSCSLFSLILIATDRYMAVFHPYTYGRLTLQRKQIAKPLALTWIISFVMVASSFLTPKFILYTAFIVVTLVILLIWSVYTQGKILKATQAIIGGIMPVYRSSPQFQDVNGNKHELHAVQNVSYSFDNRTCEIELENKATVPEKPFQKEDIEAAVKLKLNRINSGSSYDRISISSRLHLKRASCISQISSSSRLHLKRASCISQISSSSSESTLTRVAVIPQPQSPNSRTQRSKLETNQCLGDNRKAERRNVIRNAKDNFKAAKLTISIVAAQFIFYIPHGILITLYFIIPVTTKLHMTHGWTATLSLFNSGVNPIIYCWQLKGFMRAAKALLFHHEK